MQERELLKAGLGGASDQDVKLGGKPRFKNQNNMNTDINNNNNNNNININSNNNNNNSNINTNNQPPALRCPRCDSANTKFCYYNNYSLLQPRYFCKSCRRYWTKGGALRNVPIGGGCRKNKRITNRQRIPCSTSEMLSPPPNSFLSHSHFNDHPLCNPPSFSPFADPPIRPPPFSLLQNPHDHPPPPSLLYFNLPSNDPLKDNPLLNPSLQSMIPPPSAATADHHPHSHAGLFSRQLASYLPSSLASQYLSNVGFNHDYLAANQSGAAGDHQLLQQGSYNQGNPSHAAASTTTTTAGPSHEGGFKAFSLAFDNLQHTRADHDHPQQQASWGSNKIPHEQKLLTDQKVNQLSNPGMENQANLEGPNRIYTQLRPNMSPKAEEGWPPQHEAGATAGDQAANYWHNGGWNDMSGYNPGADHPFM